MADASRLKGMRRQGLGAPPSADEARTDLISTPEPRQASSHAVIAASPSTARIVDPPPAAKSPPARIDGRTLRRSGRTVQFATRVSPEFDDRVRQIAMRDGLLLVEVLERALDAYERLDRAR